MVTRDARFHLTTIKDSRKTAAACMHLTPELLKVRRALLMAGVGEEA
ncbi:hypothetical protein AB0H73_03470 [Streptomyces olivoreticuli]